jgi:CRP/FNR family cyclic AMP-dependent transcriptional regulator
MSESSHEASPKPAFDPKAFLERPGTGVTLERFQKHQHVYAQGDTADVVGYVRRGTVKATIISGRGKEAIIGIFRKGQFFGEASLNGTSVRTEAIVALDDCLITLISRETMQSMLGARPDFAAFFIAHLLSRNSRLEGDLIDQLLNSSERRLARLLLLLANAEGQDDKPIDIALSQEALADMVGTTRSRVSTFMNKFREKGLISYDSHTGKIHVVVALLMTILG